MTGKVDARAVFDHASRFHYAGAVLRIEAQAMTAPTLEPYIVVSSFCSELYMKCIYAMESGGCRILGHDLRKLFDALAPQTQSELNRGWSIIAGVYNDIYEEEREAFRLPTDLVEQLDSSGRMFEEMRYFYERTRLAQHWFLSPLPDMLRKLILERQPPWGEGADLVPGQVPAKEAAEDAESVGHWSFLMYGIPRPVESESMTGTPSISVALPAADRKPR